MLTLTSSAASIATWIPFGLSTLTFAWTLLKARQVAGYAQEMEQLRHLLRQADRDGVIRGAQTEASLGSLTEALQAVQRAKEAVMHAASPFPLGALEASLSDELRNSCNGLVVAYTSEHPHLNMLENAALHRAKNVAREAMQILYPQLQAGTTPLEDQVQTKAAHFHRQLNNEHTILLESRMRRTTSLGTVPAIRR